jgi:hypothetical protein
VSLSIDDDFEGEEKEQKKTNGKHKYTYEDLVREAGEMEDEDLPPVFEEKKAKEKFKNIINENIDKITKD